MRKLAVPGVRPAPSASKFGPIWSCVIADVEYAGRGEHGDAGVPAGVSPGSLRQMPPGRLAGNVPLAPAGASVAGVGIGVVPGVSAEERTGYRTAAERIGAFARNT